MLAPPLAQAQLADEALMRSYAAGQATAFETLYARHSLRIWRYFYRNTGDAALADDLAQDLWLTVVDCACRYEVRSRFTTWLFTMAHNRLVDHWRRQRPGISLSADTQESMRLAESLFAASGFEPEQHLDRQLMAQAILAALARLPAELEELA